MFIEAKLLRLALHKLIKIIGPMWHRISHHISDTPLGAGRKTTTLSQITNFDPEKIEHAHWAFGVGGADRRYLLHREIVVF